jgi:trimeric autotransporter adhesin
MKTNAIPSGVAQNGTMFLSYNPRSAKTFYLFTLVFCLALSSAPCALSQTPQGFNYQALAFDNSGELIRSTALPVRITIQSEAGGGTIFWQELHSSVSTNASGMFTLVVGSGVKEVGTAGTFADIDWSVTPKFIKTEIDYGGWKDLGSSQLWSVPYAMRASGIAGSLPAIDVTGASRLSTHLFDYRNIEVHNYGTGNRFAYIDLHGDDTYTDYGLRLIRYDTGLDALSRLHHRGAGSLQILTQEAAPIDFLTTNAQRMRITASGNVGIGSINPTSKLQVVPGATWSDEVPLFEVKNKKGVPVFAVYNYGVRVLVDHTYSKAVKGGFAIGGFDETKAGETVTLMLVSPDSIRFNINNSDAKAVKGGFAIGGFDETKGPINEDFMYLTPEGSTVGSYNTKVGYRAAFYKTSGVRNVYIGTYAGYFNSSGEGNFIAGSEAGYGERGNRNVIIGNKAAYKHYSTPYIAHSSTENVVIGNNSGHLNKSSYSVIIGNDAGYQTQGNGSVIIGWQAGGSVSGNSNVVIGAQAGSNLASGVNNIVLGSSANVPNGSTNNQVRIGNTDISYAGIQVAWTITSDIKWKESVRDLDYGLEFVNKLKPVDYNRIGNESRTREVGFIAQDVEKVLKELGINEAGLLSSTSEGNLELRYNDFIPILTKAIQEQQMTIESLEERHKTQQTELETLRIEMESIKAMLLREIK